MAGRAIPPTYAATASRRSCKPFNDSVLISAYDAAAPSFDHYRALPDGVPNAIHSAILATITATSPPRLLDLGAGTGRIGWPFVAAGDDYVGVDLSLGMLREFARRVDRDNRYATRLVQADGERLPFGDAMFDAVILIQITGAARDWRRLIGESRRVLRSPGALVIGQSVMPTDGLDARMKQRLASYLDRKGVASYHVNARDDVQHRLEAIAHRNTRLVAAAWDAERTPRGFLQRQRSGAQFSKLPDAIKADSLRTLSAWAAATFGSLDASFAEKHVFELRIFEFHDGGGR
jgi:demethylmenaquinone methyltransferase/2-methoxy-6-polyprenyl-1,4-benzoquinol methylase